jgi:DNA-binding NarL/FixJ family response regulator
VHAPWSLERPVSLMIVDDHRIFAEVLALRLRREPSVTHVVVAHGLGEAKALARRDRPDVVLLDQDLGGEPGNALIPHLRELPDPPSVLMLSASEEADEVIAALECGAAAWVVKGVDVDVLMSAIGEVLRGGTYLDPSAVGPVVRTLLRRKQARAATTFVDDLSERQLEVLRCLVGGLSRAETATRLFISANTVRTHVQNMLHAAGEHSTLALVARAREVGVTAPDDGSAPSSSR